jgi:hypothetical protein
VREDEGMGSAVDSPPFVDSKRGELMIRLFRELQTARFSELYYQRRGVVSRMGYGCGYRFGPGG